MIGECVEAKGELGEAVARYKEALNMPQVTATESLELYYLLGSVFERLGDVREALYFFENLRKRDATFRDVVRRIAALQAPSEREPDAIRSSIRRAARRSRGDYFQRAAGSHHRRPRGRRRRRRFREDAWTRPTGGGGRTRVLADGSAVREGRASRFSDVHGALRPEMAARAPRRGRRPSAPPGSR